jgi:hypothetical protein
MPPVVSVIEIIGNTVGNVLFETLLRIRQRAWMRTKRQEWRHKEEYAFNQPLSWSIKPGAREVPVMLGRDPGLDISGAPSLTCPICKRTTHNRHDIQQGYCGFCHRFTSPALPDRVSET